MAKKPRASYVPSQQKIGECTSCHRPIIWRYNMATQKYSPWDPPHPCSGCDGRGADDDGVSCEKCDSTGKAWLSHFASCKNAAKHRKPK